MPAVNNKSKRTHWSWQSLPALVCSTYLNIMKLIPLSKYRTGKWEILEYYRDVTVMILIALIFLACCYGEAHIEGMIEEAAAKQND